MTSDFDVDKFIESLGIRNPSPSSSQSETISTKPYDSAAEYLRIIDAVNQQAMKIFDAQISIIERFTQILKK